MPAPIRLDEQVPAFKKNVPVIGVFCAGDPRIDKNARQRCVNIVKMAAEILARNVKLPDGTAAKVVWAPLLVDGEKQADIVAKQFQARPIPGPSRSSA